MSEMKEGFVYQVLRTGENIFQLGAVIDANEVMHGGNIHMLQGVYGSREDAELALLDAITQKLEEAKK